MKGLVRQTRRIFAIALEGRPAAPIRRPPQRQLTRSSVADERLLARPESIEDQTQGRLRRRRDGAPRWVTYNINQMPEEALSLILRQIAVTACRAFSLAGGRCKPR